MNDIEKRHEMLFEKFGIKTVTVHKKGAFVIMSNGPIEDYKKEKLKDYLHKELKKFELDYGADPLKLNYLCFIYKDVVYSIKPETMDLPCDVLKWLYGTYFDNHCPLMINIMKKDLGIKYAKYGGMFD